ncbi:MAG: type II toxin-antitoxin system VapC family toxin [Methylocystis sp.]|nr:type II toxin-antitoxin system VapC family toxin [Methylocystis sp.]
MTLADTNVLIDILSRDPVWYSWSASRFAEQMTFGPLVIVDVVFAECAGGFASAEDVAQALSDLSVERLAMSDTALYLAGRVFREYRRRGGPKTNVLADFFIGAQANALGVPILTRDATRYRTYFPQVEIIAP